MTLLLCVLAAPPRVDAEPEGSAERETTRAVWQTASLARTLRVFGPPETAVNITCLATLAELDYRWEQPVLYTDESGVVDVVIDPPPEAFLHETAADYLTDLRVRVAISGERPFKAGEAVLAWPDGAEGDALIWTASQHRARAPGGVLRAELRPEDVDENMRLMPDLAPLSDGGEP